MLSCPVPGCEGSAASVSTSPSRRARQAKGPFLVPGPDPPRFLSRRRPGCTFTFKNKCDIEKHKSYHIKDDAYAKDGFKKFYKYEECKYEGCVYSKATNHFHCIRPGCGFTFTSTSQMTSHKRKHERRHIRSSGMLGLPASLLGAKENEQEESSNDDLIDFSAMSSKNSSLSASPTSQQSSVSLIVPGTPSSAAELAASKPASNMPSASKMPALLSQALPSNIPLALALPNAALPGTAGPYFPMLPSRVSAQLPASSTGLLAAGTPSTNPASSASSPSPALSGSGEAAAISSPTPAASIMEKISASKGLISPMMARLAAAALKPSVAVEAGESLGRSPPSSSSKRFTGETPKGRPSRSSPPWRKGGRVRSGDQPLGQLASRPYPGLELGIFAVLSRPAQTGSQGTGGKMASFPGSLLFSPLFF